MGSPCLSVIVAEIRLNIRPVCKLTSYKRSGSARLSREYFLFQGLIEHILYDDVSIVSYLIVSCEVTRRATHKAIKSFFVIKMHLVASDMA